VAKRSTGTDTKWGNKSVDNQSNVKGGAAANTTMQQQDQQI
jgi:hypothetical protein